ncbi:uncharacterized protein T551_02606 [Pneumocystis jirovecii RU7]|uniref:Inositol-pentakisphosphate 2-kinase n=1 Tax=Pneumocystis jirovecii (strain RU7) TaxID=1408657 RepID=A0A0W4ZK54_PNEJ7|nr:uncharacterized protein T551_02606 [Pneumocystis jirovecii RU7]KTW28756.1 hypothetical protein T551_02606 [Pneumocystis jirovecii RU7]
MDIDQLAKIDPSDWIYFSEGNRNVIFKYKGSDSFFINKVLRIKKTQHPISTLENLKFIQSIIIPLFYEPFDRYILSIELIMVEIAVLKKFNIDLIQKYERKKKFSNTLLDISENHAFLLKDLSSSFPKHTIEFKPKWLIQSVSAPIGWKSCRTCALRRLRGDISGNGTRYCPLDLASENQTRIQKSIKAILIKNQIYNQNIEINLSTYLQRSQLINHLKYLQSSSPRTLSMVFFDCTIYITFLHEEIFDIKILDLDCKSQTKVEYWDKIEQQLIDEGWYLGRGMANDEEPCCL